MAVYRTKLHFDNSYESPWVLDRLELYQAGECFTKTGYQTNEHIQWCDEISYVISGEATILVSGKSYHVRAGDLVVSPKGSTHKITSSEENPIRFFYIGYRLIDTHPQFDKWKPIQETLCRLDVAVHHNAFNMMHLFYDLLGEFQQEFSKRDMLIELAALQIILYTYKYFSGGEKRPAVYENRVPDKQELVYRITHFIDNNVSKIRNLTDVSDYIGFSYSYTSQIFSGIMGMSLKTYYQKKRFEEAVSLLKSGLSVTQVSEILGFDSVHSFSRAFKTQYQKSPQNYIKQASEDD